jgi:spermidine/putrescine transport system ATP-binding protein
MAQIPAVDRNTVNDLQPGQAARWYYDPATVHLLCEGEGA